MSSTLTDGPPEAKKFRMEITTQEDVSSSSGSPSSNSSSLASLPSGSSLEGQPMTGEAPLEGQSPGAPSSARSSNGSVTNEKDDETDVGMTGNLLEMISKSLLGNVFKLEDLSRPRSLTNSPTPQGPVVPGAQAVAQSPAAQLFSEEDWSWHRNPAAAIRSGGTNKQTPVWKYFVYNKVENLSRCIVGECTYMLKGPHTSTLACHLKKHPKEYAEFQKLKVDYTRDRHGGQIPQSPTSPMAPCQQRPPKQKKDHRQENINNLANSLRMGQSAGSSPMPNMVQNLMGINPLQFMMNQQKQSAAAGANAAQAASQMLQQAGLAVSSTGQIMQSKKWRRDERRQRELESRLALALAASHLPLESLHCPLWRDLMEAAQPKFTFPDDINDMEQLLSSHHSRLTQSIRSHLSSCKKFCLVVEVVRVNGTTHDESILRIAVSATFHAFHGSKFEMQNVLLAFRPLADTSAETITSAVEQILSEYDMGMERISRVLCPGISTIGPEETEKPREKVFENEMLVFSETLFSCFNSFIESSPLVDELRKAVFSLIFAFVTKPEALQALNKATGDAVDLPLTDPFPLLAEAVLKIKDALNVICEQGHIAASLTQEQWTMLRAIQTTYSMFRQATSGDVITIDGAIPAIKQLLLSLEKDTSISCISSDLRSLITEKMRNITDVDAADFDGSFIQATALNPQLAVLLNEQQIEYVKKEIERQLCSRLRSQSRPFAVDELLANVMHQSKMNGGVDMSTNQLYADILQQAHERLQQDRAPARDRMAEALVKSYFEEVLSGCSVESLLSPFGGGRSFGNPFQPPMQFWMQAAGQCPQLSELATELLSIPASPIGAQRHLALRPATSPWPTHTEPSLVLAHLEKPERFERDLLLRVNRNMLPKTY